MEIVKKRNKHGAMGSFEPGKNNVKASMQSNSSRICLTFYGEACNEIYSRSKEDKANG